jgi:hypothetical protein
MCEESWPELSAKSGILAFYCRLNCRLLSIDGRFGAANHDILKYEEQQIARSINDFCGFLS